jgi:NADPH:quinone reductase-like Zn-dependent oxidoreductase
VLVLGASGGVGHLAVQIARQAGASVVGVCSTRNADWVSSLGAKVVDYSKADLLAELRAMGPFDAIVDGVGSATYPRGACVAMLKTDGVLVQVVPRALDLPFLALPGRVHTVLGRATRERLGKLVDGVSAGWLEVRVAERIPLAEAERAHETSRSGRVVGKLVLTSE